MGTDSEAKENVWFLYDASNYLQSIGVFMDAREVWESEHVLNPGVLTSD